MKKFHAYALLILAIMLAPIAGYLTDVTIYQFAGYDKPMTKEYYARASLGEMALLGAGLLCGFVIERRGEE